MDTKTLRHTETIEILKLLANGFDPATLKELPQDSVYQNQKVIRSLFFAISELESRGEKPQDKGNAPATKREKEPKPKIVGRKWSKEENDILKNGLENGKTISELAAEIDRTEKSIRYHLIKLNISEK